VQRSTTGIGTRHGGFRGGAWGLMAMAGLWSLACGGAKSRSSPDGSPDGSPDVLSTAEAFVCPPVSFDASGACGALEPLQPVEPSAPCVLTIPIPPPRPEQPCRLPRQESRAHERERRLRVRGHAGDPGPHGNVLRPPCREPVKAPRTNHLSRPARPACVHPLSCCDAW